LLPALGEPSPSVEPQDKAITEKVDALFAPWSKGGTPGAAVIVIRDGTILLKKGYGLANLEEKRPITTDTVFRLASVTKQFTAMSIMMLAERGKLKYEYPLASFFPEFPPYASKITVRHLLNHMAGFPEYDELWLENGKIDGDWPRSSKTRSSSFEPTSKDALLLLGQVKKPEFTPGTEFKYSNSGYVILAQIVEKVSGQSFSQFLQQNIFQPLGMKRSLLDDETRPALGNVATSYTLKEGSYKDIDYTPVNFIYGEDNVFSTVEDMYQWDQALYTERLVKTATLKEAFAPGKLSNGATTHYGFGWGLGKTLGLDTVSHSGGWVGFCTEILRFPSEHFTVVVLSNVAEFKPERIATKISKIYLADKMTFPVAIPLDPKIKGDYPGKYELGPARIAEITLENGQLWIQSPGREKIKLLAESKERFFGEGNEELGLVFTRDEKGKVKSLKVKDVTARRLP
jgi:CubicO group peptidase (beta-lactamase class C family)